MFAPEAASFGLDPASLVDRAPENQTRGGVLLVEDEPTIGILLEQRGLAVNYVNAPAVYVVIGGEAERKAAFAGIRSLRAAGIRADYPFKDLAFGKQSIDLGVMGVADPDIVQRRIVRRRVARPSRWYLEVAERLEQRVRRL